MGKAPDEFGRLPRAGDESAPGLRKIADGDEASSDTSNLLDRLAVECVKPLILAME